MHSHSHYTRRFPDYHPKPSLLACLLALLLLPVLVTGCASVSIKEAGSLTSYSNLGPPKGKLSKKRIFVDEQHLAQVKTVRMVPTTLSLQAAGRIKSDADRRLVANALDRSLCDALSDKYQMVPYDQPADMTVRSVVADIVLTDKAVAGVATAVSLGTNFVLPIGVPRLPFGLGGLAVEAEAVDRRGVQRAAMLWARGANSIQDSPRVSEVGDAYGLATKFSSDFSRMLIAGTEPKGLKISLPSRQKIKFWLGGKPKYAACEAFGRAPGLTGAIAEKVGAPPQWIDKKPKPVLVH